MSPQSLTPGIRTKRVGIIGPFLLTALLALIVGILFRYYSLTGVGFYRMFATMGIVFTGVAAVMVVHRLQLAEAYAVLEDALTDSTKTLRVWSARRPGHAAVLHLVMTSHALVAVGTEEVGNRIKDQRLLRKAVAKGRRLHEAADQWRQEWLEELAKDQSDELLPEEAERLAALPILPIVVLLRKEVPEAAAAAPFEALQAETVGPGLLLRHGDGPDPMLLIQPEEIGTMIKEPQASL